MAGTQIPLFTVIRETGLACSCFSPTPSASLSHAVITRLAEQKAAIIHCAHNQMPVSLSLPFSANTLQGERLTAQTDLSKPRQKRLWQQIITTKIKLQAAVLLSVRQDSFGLDKMALRVASGDKQNHEAQAAQLYWPRLFGKSFRRLRTGAPPNHLLNYGYAMIRAATARALTMAGLHPGIGVVPPQPVKQLSIS